MNNIIAVVIAIVGVIVLIGLILTIPVYYLWNWLMPELFGFRVITFWQAMGISFLSSCLFKSSSSSSKS